MKEFLYQNWFKILAILFLLIALADNPYGYYQFLRWVVLVAGIYSAHLAHKLGNKSWPWIFGIIAILFNPIIPLTFQRGTWQFIDVIVAIIFFVSLFNKREEKDKKITTSIDEPLEKREFERVISEKEKVLNELIEQIEQLKIDLTIVKQEYEVKVGRLYLRLDEVDLEILKFKKIEDLINRGFSFEEAQKVVEETLKKRREQIEEEYKKLDEEEKEIESRKGISEEGKEELRKLWHKLAHKFHPDKANGNEEMMKKINKAYAEGDLETLRAIEQSETGVDVEVKTIEALKNKLMSIEKSIVKINQEFEQLKRSEWYILKENIEKAKKQERDILSELADKVLTDIAKKENQLGELKKKHGQR